MTHTQTLPAEAPVWDRPRSTFRPDVEGMRAIAVTLVVAFHAGVPFIQGGYVGVDVFFVISGFLITGLLIADIGKSERLSLTTFYARRIRRLLPLSTVVLVFVAIMAVLIIPPLTRADIGGDINAAALWYANIHFAAQSTSYMSAVDQSPVLHYWSLSVEEQFYVIWPLLIIVVGGTVAVGAGLEIVRHRRLAIALWVLFAISLGLSIFTSGSSGPWAYFGLQTRAWELAAGGLLALFAVQVRQLPRVAAVLAGYLGLVMVIGSALVFSRATTFPGWAALVPVGGTALLLAAGARPRIGGAPRILSAPALMYVGRISFGWYLWHWPLLVFAKAIWSPNAQDVDLEAIGTTAPQAGPWPVVGAVVLSFLLAVLTNRFIEDPIRKSEFLAKSKPATFAMGAGLIVLAVGVPSFLLGASSPLANTPAILAAGLSSTVGDSALSGEKLPSTLTMTPARAHHDDTAPSNCFLSTRLEEKNVDPSCRFGPVGGPVVALIGDSHAAHWFPALQDIAKKNGWQLLMWTKAACGVADVPMWSRGLSREYTECEQWRESVMKQLESEPRLDAVVISRAASNANSTMDSSGNRPGGDAALKIWGEGLGRTFTRLLDKTKEIVVLRDVPRPGFGVPGCLSEHPKDFGACAYPRSGHFGLDDKLYQAELQYLPAGGRVHYINLSKAICPGDPCQVVTSTGTIKYRDLHHLTATYARELAPKFAKSLASYVDGRP